MVEIIPSILTNSPEELRLLLSKVEGLTQRAQIDIVDGVFAANRTLEPSALEEIETDLKLDFHLMTKEPIDWIEGCVRGMADRIIGQIELMSSQIEFVGHVQEVGALVGLAIDIETPVAEIDSAIINSLDVVLVMSVPAGFGGQKFDERALEKIKQLDEIRVRDDTPFRICDDGGISLESIYSQRVAGVDEVAIGKKLFKGDVIKNIDKFKRAMYKNIE